MIYNHRILPMVVGGVIIGCPNLQTIIHDDLWMISSHNFWYSDIRRKQFNKWPFEVPKLEVLNHIKPCFVCVSSYRAFKIDLSYYLQFRFLTWPLAIRSLGRMASNQRSDSCSWLLEWFAFSAVDPRTCNDRHILLWCSNTPSFYPGHSTLRVVQYLWSRENVGYHRGADGLDMTLEHCTTFCDDMPVY